MVVAVVGNEDVAAAVVVEIGQHELARVLRLRNVSAEERVRVVDEFAVAVTDENGQSMLWVVSAGKATRRAIVLGPDRLDQIEVKSGLAPGEPVIVNPPAGLTDGAVVKVKGS